jgi:SAM-dependent methyltransferase
VSAFYERHPYPPPVESLQADRRLWDNRRRRADFRLFWPAAPFRDDLSILVAGCGASQAARYAVRWPRAKVVGIDVSGSSLAATAKLKREHGLSNLELRHLPLERAAELGGTFDHVVCTGVLHHLSDPDAGLVALRKVLTAGGALHLMVYAPYGRAGIYQLQDYCRRLGVRPTNREIDDLLASLRGLPPDHPLAPLLRASPDFRSRAGIADALLNPQDRPYSVPQLLDLVRCAGLEFGRWLRQAPYLPQCGALGSLPHRPLLERLPLEEQWAAVELYRGTMVRHSLIAYRSDGPQSRNSISFEGDGWLAYAPVRTAGTISVHERLPLGAAAVLINPAHNFTDLVLPIDARQAEMLGAIDGERTIGEIAGARSNRSHARDFFLELWRYDQIVFDTSRAGRLQ